MGFSGFQETGMIKGFFGVSNFKFVAQTTISLSYGFSDVYNRAEISFYVNGPDFFFSLFLSLVLDTSFSSLFQKTPTLLWVTPYLGLDTPTGMEFLCILGILLSLVLLVSQRCRDCLGFLVLWFLYYSMLPVSYIKSYCVFVIQI